MHRHILAVGALGLIASLAGAVRASAQELIPCAREGGYCQVPYPTTVVYGARGRATSLTVARGGIRCNNNVFGDPAPGVVKRCGYIARDFGRGQRFDGDERRRRYYY